MGKEEGGMRNAEWGRGNGECGMGNGEWGMGNAECGIRNSEWGMRNEVKRHWGVGGIAVRLRIWVDGT